eukprot:12647769-Alexandrium_andersonii.AAC.1
MPRRELQPSPWATGAAQEQPRQAAHERACSSIDDYRRRRGVDVDGAGEDAADPDAELRCAATTDW